VSCRSGPFDRVRGVLLAPRFGVMRLVLTCFLLLSLLTRIGLLAMHRAPSVDGLVLTAAALARGTGFDLLAALWILAPLTLYLALVPERWFRWRGHAGALRAGVFLGLYAMLFIALAEGFFFAEFDGRFNFVAVDYLIFPTEVTLNLWESYPLVWLLGGLLVVTLVIARLLRGRLARLTAGPTAPALRVGFTACHAAGIWLLGVLLAPMSGNLSEDRALNEIVGNGYHAFWSALIGQDAPYEGRYASIPIDEALTRLPRLLAEPATVPGSFVAGSVRRRVEPGDSIRRLNVVIVLEESFGSAFVGALQSGEPGLTPHFDSLAAEGTLLVNAYSTGNRTIRAIEAITASLPPLPGISLVRRPASQDLFTLPALLRERGYRTMFNYGGRALFDGMGSYLRNNGVDRIIELDDYPDSAFRTAWGVADEVIFDRALAEMDTLATNGDPFYALVLSVSNHKPYRFPALVVARVPKLGGRRNAVRYADYALGRFLRQARSHPFFDNTLFVLIGDHGARVYGAAEIPLASYEVPILFYAPKWIPSGVRVATLASTLDVAPTILGVLGLGYESRFFGQDILRLPAAAGRAPMTHNSVVSVMDDSTLVVLGLHGSIMLYRREGGAVIMAPQSRWTGADRERVEDAIAFYTGADWLYRNGGQLLQAGPTAGRATPPSEPSNVAGTTRPPAD